MGRRSRNVTLLMAVVSFVSLSAFAQQSRTRAPQKTAAPQDLKIKFKTTTAGQTSESVTMIKGARERSEMRIGQGMDTVNITQCDLKRTVQLSEKTQKYLITPMVLPDSGASASNSPSVSTPAEPSRRGGVLTYVTTATDTGERKEMFGFTARHVKTTLLMKSSPDACNAVDQRMETDGWYIDLSFGLDCNLGRPQMMANRPPTPSGCQDRVVFKQEGAARTGYPLVQTMTMYGPGGQAVFTTTREVLELSREPLDAALFDVPQGYTEVANSQEFYSALSMNPMENKPEPNTQGEASTTVDTKQPGTIRVGVVRLNNKSDRSVSVDVLRARLMGGIQTTGIDAVALNAISEAEAEAEAKAKQCDFILYTDIKALKLSAAKKLGGFLGQAAGVAGAAKTEARVEYRLVAVGESSPRLQSSATGKEEGDEASVGTALDAEARAVSTAVRKKG